MKTSPPGPRGLAVLGLLGGGRFENTLRFLVAQADRYGPVVSFRIAGRAMYLVDDPELLREVLVAQQQRFSRAAATDLLRDVTGVTLATTDEPLHRRRRRLLQPAFAQAEMGRYGQIMASEARRFADDRFDGELFDLGAAMTRLTLEVAANALFGIGAGADARVMSEALGRAMRSISRLGLALEIAPSWFGVLRRRLPLRENSEFRRARATLRAAVHGSIARYYKGSDERHACDGLRRNGGGALERILSAPGRSRADLDDLTIGDELCGLLFAGHETTATALAWAWYLLATHPSAEARLHAELDAVLGGRDPEPADLKQLPYTTAIFAETLRLYPPAAVYGRRTIEPAQLGGYEIPRDAGVIVSPYVSHRNARYFCSPERFMPERWENPAWPDFAYIPFGGGARRCIGEAFARLEGPLILATLARRYRFERIERAPVGISSAMLRPSRPIVVRARTRRRDADVHHSRREAPGPRP